MERNTFGNSKAFLEEKHRVLEELMGLNNVENVEAIKRVKEEINTRLYNDELHWHQRSRSIWLTTGDKNTKFFHQRASQWRRKNHIGGVFDNNGEWWESNIGIATVAEKYFQDLFTTTNPSNMDNVLNAVDRVVTPDKNHMLQTRLYPKTITLLNIFLLDVTNPSLGSIFFLYPPFLQTFQKINNYAINQLFKLQVFVV